MTHPYDINQSDCFKANLYPQVVNELITLQQRFINIKTPFKTEVVISFLKNHSIANKWLKSDAEVSKLITSGILEVSHTESLFSSCRHNRKFLDDFEKYIKSLLE